LDARNCCGLECGVGVVDRAGEVHRAGSVFDDDGVEAEGFAVDGGVPNAEVVGEAAEEEAMQIAFAEIAGETGGRDVVVLEEGGVGVDVAAEAFAEDELGVREVERGVEVCAFGVLEAVSGPEGLGAVGGFNDVVGLMVGMGARERDVLGRVPVLGEYDVGEFSREGVD